MEKGLKYAYDAIRKFGIKTLFEAIGTGAWFLLPFVVWIRIYYLLGTDPFQFSWILILGLIVTAFITIMLVVLGLRLSRLDNKLMKNIDDFR